ncbi:MAG: cysteine desulfurase family protein [Syntrophobacteraceae bacterium]|nr:cysteine desulfurase family protein [Syntrophobacteraceae bacterium]
MKPIYLDYNATTPSEPEVVEELLPYLCGEFGNPSSGHAYGKKAREAVELARIRMAALLGCDPSEVLFTGGGTESNNQALIGAALANKERGNHIISTTIEHPAVLKPLERLVEQGFSVTLLPVDGTGRLDPEEVRRAITPGTILVSVMHANNEVGTIQPLREIGGICSEKGIIFHTDAAQSVGKIPTLVGLLQVDLLSVAGHKFYAPKGVGALYVRRGVKVNPCLFGAGQEEGRRPGTENVPYIVALGKAAELASLCLASEGARILSLREHFFERLKALIEGVRLNGHPVERLPNTLNVSFRGVGGAQLLERTPEIAASTGSACHEGSGELSGVLKAMGMSREQGFGAVRLSIGRPTTAAEIERAAEVLAERVGELRAGNR